MLRLSLEERKDYIAKAATKVFDEKGYQTASIADVSTEVGISKAGIYHYFKSKEELLGYLITTHTDRFLELLQNSLNDSKKKKLSPQETFEKLMRVYAAFINIDMHHRTVVLRERHQLTGTWQKELKGREQSLFRILRDTLSKIPKLDKTINLNVITFLFISMSHWLGYWVKEGGELTLDDAIDQNIKAVLSGVLKKKPLRQPKRGPSRELASRCEA